MTPFLKVDFLIFPKIKIDYPIVIFTRILNSSEEVEKKRPQFNFLTKKKKKKYTLPITYNIARF